MIRLPEMRIKSRSKPLDQNSAIEFVPPEARRRGLQNAGELRLVWVKLRKNQVREPMNARFRGLGWRRVFPSRFLGFHQNVEDRRGSPPQKIAGFFASSSLLAQAPRLLYALFGRCVPRWGCDGFVVFRLKKRPRHFSALPGALQCFPWPAFSVLLGAAPLARL